VVENTISHNVGVPVSGIRVTACPSIANKVHHTPGVTVAGSFTHIERLNPGVVTGPIVNVGLFVAGTEAAPRSISET
jgi:hypothetical protein